MRATAEHFKLRPTQRPRAGLRPYRGRMRRMLIALAGLCVIAAAFGIYVLRERDRVAVESIWGWSCSVGRCTLEYCSDHVCTHQERAACFGRRVLISDEEADRCFSTVATCEESRSKALSDPDIGDVGRCRIVDAGREARES